MRGLKEAGDDESIGAVVLRIDSGGGGVVESDTIWGAVRDLRERKGKTVVASFGNASASGGYLVSTHTDAIFAAPSTVTGSIGVASLRPTFLESFFDRFHVTLESFFTGSRSQDVTHRLSPEELARHSSAVDGMYDDFKNRVCQGRGISPDVIEGIAGGRVMTGLKAFSLTAPPELIRQIKGLDHDDDETLTSSPSETGPGGPAAVAEAERTGEEGDKRLEDETVSRGKNESLESPRLEATTEPDRVVVSSVRADEGGRPRSVRLDEDQDSSPFAIIVEEGSSPEQPGASTTGPITPEAHVRDALLTSTRDEQLSNSEIRNAAKSSSRPGHARLSTQGGGGGANNGVSGEFEYEVGPYGRGLVDGLGGLRDAAVYACQLFV